MFLLLANVADMTAFALHFTCLIRYITQQQNDAMCEQSLLCTENYETNSKLQFNNNVEETRSRAQIIQTAHSSAVLHTYWF